MVDRQAELAIELRLIRRRLGLNLRQWEDRAIAVWELARITSKEQFLLWCWSVPIIDQPRFKDYLYRYSLI